MARIAISVAVLRLTAVLLVPVFSACSMSPSYSPDLTTLSPLHHDALELSVAEARQMAPTPDLLALNDEMRDFADRYVLTGRSQRQRLHLLHSSLRSDALLGIDYVSEADGSAAETFASGRANCLSYAHLFVSMARYAGLNARYQSLTLRPEWTRYGDRVALRQHVNVVVILRNKEEFMVDIQPVQRSSVTGTRKLTDQTAFALYHSNLAMHSLREDSLAEAYAHAIKAVGLSSSTDYLWINLGAIYSRAGQSDSAEQSYLTALKLNAASRSAMNNLQVLYNRRGDAERAAYWGSKIIGYRNRNPYYYAYLGDEAAADGDLLSAIEHYRTAISRKDSDADLYFRLGKLYFDLREHARSIHYVEMAIERSRLVGEREVYQAFLDQIDEPSLAQLN